MYLLVIIKEVNVEEMLAALLPGGGLSTGYSYPLVTINSLAFASQLITVRSLCPPPSPSSPPPDGRILLFLLGGLCVFVVLFFPAFVRTWVRDQSCVVGARGPQVTVVDRRGKHTLPFVFCEYVFFCCCFFYFILSSTCFASCDSRVTV